MSSFIQRLNRLADGWRNRGELAKGWYDPARQNTNTSTISPPVERKSRKDGRIGQDTPRRSPAPSHTPPQPHLPHPSDDAESDSDDSSIVGPLPPGHIPSSSSSNQHTPASAAFPTPNDLTLQREESLLDRERAREELAQSRKADRALQKERLEELAPRADPGSRERKLEKKQEVNAKMQSFRERSPGGEVPESELMGGAGGTESFKQLKAAKERKKNERELRKEAMLRQRQEEREVRLKEHREKEEKTIAMLRALAEANYKR